MATAISQTRRRKAGGANDATLNSAIVFYFQLKADALGLKEIPSASEFFGYTFKVNNAIAHNKSSSIPIGSESMNDFLSQLCPYVRGQSLFVRLLRCLTIVADALLVWQVTQAFIMLFANSSDMCGGCKTVKCVLTLPNIIEQRKKSMHNYLLNCVPLFRVIKDAVVDQMEEYIMHRIDVLHSVPPITADGCMMSVGNASLIGLKHRNQKIYKSYVGTPFFRLFRVMGFTSVGVE